jgi:hypothetical protein
VRELIDHEPCAGFPTPAEQREWLADFHDALCYPGDRLLSEAWPVSQDPPHARGIYFLIWQGKVCYVGQAGSVFMRLEQHRAERRPFTHYNGIVGLPAWALSTVEYAYVDAWDPPWNEVARRSVCASAELRAAVAAAKENCVAEWHPPRYKPPLPRHKKWQAHVLGYRQYLEQTTPPASSPARE